MSTCYRFNDVIKAKKLVKAANKLGFTVEEDGDDSFSVNDGDLYLWFYTDGEDIVDICRYGVNFGADKDILAPLAEELQTTFLSEYDEGYFEEEEEENE
jgi:hypothetical protein